MAFDLSARITADASGLVSAAGQGEAAYEGLGRSAKEAATGAKSLETATEGLATAEARAGAAATGMGDAIVNAAKRGAAAQREAAKAQADAAASLNRQGFAVRNLGAQFGDFATQVSLGGGVIRAFSSQIGQVAFALSEFEKGPLKRVGSFLAGPWGIALTVATVVLAPFVEKLFEGGKAAEELLDKTSKAATAADSYGNAQGFLGKAIDLTTGKLKTQNETLIQTIQLQARAGILKAQQDQRDARDALRGAGDPGFFRGAATAGGQVQGPGFIAAAAGALNSAQGGAASGNNAQLAAIARRFAAGKLTQAQAQARIDRLNLGEARAVEEGLKLSALATAQEDEKANREALEAARGGKLSAGLRQYQRPKKPKAPKKPASTAGRDEFGEDAADRLANLRDSLTDTPDAIRRVNTQVRQLDDLIDDLARKKPPGFEKLIADARSLKPLIEDSINRPFRDFVEDQARSLDVQRLIAAGRTDEAATLRQIQQLERTGLVLSTDQKDAILAANQALREQQREADILQQKQRNYLTALDSIRESVRGALFDGKDGIEALPGRLIKAFSTLKANELFDRLFDGVFRDLEDQINGTSTAKDASERFAKAVDEVTRKSGATATALGSIKPPVDNATAALGNFTNALNGAASAAAGGAQGSTASGMATLQSLLAQYKGPDGPTVTEGEGEIVVTGKRTSTLNPEALFSKGLGGVAEKIVGAFTNPETGKRIGGALGQFAGKGIAGAAEGVAINSYLKPIAGALGLKTSKTGAAVGGAVGSFIPIPGGREIGAVVGSLIGGAFKTTKTGSATIGSVDGVAGVTGTGGNNARLKTASSGLAGAVGDTINTIVQQLGGELGQFAVSIGSRDGKFQVDTTGRGRTTRGKSNDGVTTYNTEAEAQAAALADAIADGAIAGLSDAVQRAFRSTTDVDKALREALGVKNLEAALDGAGGSLKGIFNTEKAAAKERLRLARAYGLDIVKVEKLNADQRAKLIDDTLKSRLGSLTDFLASVNSGDLFEGSASERRSALLTQIAKAQTDAEAGVEGAADQLAALSAQLISFSRDAFGTADPQYGADRANTISGVERVIAMERTRIEEASRDQAATTDAVNSVAAGVDETNDLLARLNANVGALPSAIAALIGGGGGSGYDALTTGRQTNLALA